MFNADRNATRSGLCFSLKTKNAGRALWGCVRHFQFKKGDELELKIRFIQTNETNSSQCKTE